MHPFPGPRATRVAAAAAGPRFARSPGCCASATSGHAAQSARPPVPTAAAYSCGRHVVFLRNMFALGWVQARHCAGLRFASMLGFGPLLCWAPARQCAGPQLASALGMHRPPTGRRRASPADQLVREAHHDTMYCNTSVDKSETSPGVPRHAATGQAARQG